MNGGTVTDTTTDNQTLGWGAVVAAFNESGLPPPPEHR